MARYGRKGYNHEMEDLCFMARAIIEIDSGPGVMKSLDAASLKYKTLKSKPEHTEDSNGAEGSTYDAADTRVSGGTWTLSSQL